jgi:hypothetical protein
MSSIEDPPIDGGRINIAELLGEGKPFPFRDDPILSMPYDTKTIQSSGIGPTGMNINRNEHHRGIPCAGIKDLRGVGVLPHSVSISSPTHDRVRVRAAGSGRHRFGPDLGSLRC